MQVGNQPRSIRNQLPCTYNLFKQLSTSSLKSTKPTKSLKSKPRTKKLSSSAYNSSTKKPKRKILLYERSFEFTQKEKRVMELLSEFCLSKRNTFYTPQEKFSLRLYGSYVKLKVSITQITSSLKLWIPSKLSLIEECFEYYYYYKIDFERKYSKRGDRSSRRWNEYIWVW
jgi:hypothetical protein